MDLFVVGMGITIVSVVGSQLPDKFHRFGAGGLV
jgi:hypothetical protein